MKLIILDRDGVINTDSEAYIKNVDEWEAIPDSIEAIANLTQAGFNVVVCTNQSGIGRGLYNMQALNEIHERMHKLVEQAGGNIAAIFFCPHKPEDNCNCRKPKPGMILDICERFNVDEISSVMFVGDSIRDLEAITAAGGIPVLVKTGNGKKTLNKNKLPLNTLIFENLLEVSEYIINKDNDKKMQNKKTLSVILRSIVFWLIMGIITIIFFPLSIFLYLFNVKIRHRVITSWAHIATYLAKYLCKINYIIIGQENLSNPLIKTAAVAISNHQSMWETMALNTILPPHVWILKKEIIRIPFFGWAIKTVSPIAIDRSDRLVALQQVLSQSVERIKLGFWILAFPEGTRAKIGEILPFKTGVAKMAIKLGLPIVLIAHNAGKCIPKNSFWLYPGIITVVINKPFLPNTTDPELLTQEMRQSIISMLKQDN